MYTNARSVTSNGNKGGQAQAQPQSIPSRQGVGNKSCHTSEVGAGQKHAQRTDDAWAANKGRRSVGDQTRGHERFASSGTGGPASRSPQAWTATQGQADDTARRVGGLTFAQRKARLAHGGGTIVPVPSSNAARSACPPTLLLAGKRQPEPSSSRPVGGQDSLSLFGCPGFTGRPLRRFQALAEEQVRLRPLISRRWEASEPQEPEPEPATPKPTAAMLLAAEASDMREAFPAYFDDEEAAACGFATATCPADPALAQD